MPVNQRTAGEYHVLAVSGDIRGGEPDFAKLRRLGHVCLGDSPLLAVNLRHVTFVDSQTLGLFVELLRTAQARGGEAVLVEVGERAAKWFSLSGLDQVFKMVPEEAALAAASSPAGAAEAPRNSALEAVNIDRMVAELQAALGEAGDTGEPQIVGPIDEKALTEIEKLLSSS